MRVTMRNCRALGALAVAGALALATAGPAAADFSATEGAQFSGQVATFQDACVSDPPEIGTPTTYTCPSPGDYSATIHWGDGASSAGSVSGGTDCGGGHAANHTCTFAVSGTHTYSEENGYSVTVDWSASASGFGDGTTSAATASVGDAALSPIGGLSPSMIETDTGPVNVGRFSDANPSAFAANFTAVVHWGDGTSSSGGVTIDGSGGFYVYGAHGYPEEGTYTVTADVTDDGGATTQTSSSMTITAGPLRAPSDTTRPTFLGSGVFGHAYSMPQLGPFFDDVSPGPAGDYAVNVSWGDGTSGDGTVTGRNPSFGPGYIAGGTHTYGSSTPGPLPVVWSGREVEAGGASTGSLVNVIYLTAPLTGVEGSSAFASGDTVGYLVWKGNGSCSAAPSSGNWSVDWGDGSDPVAAHASGAVTTETLGGTLRSCRQAVVADAGHTYAEEGGYAIAVSGRVLNFEPTIVISNWIDIADGGLSAAAYPVYATAAAPFSGTVGHFTDADPNGAAGDFTATIDWGDGHSSAGTVVANSGGFDVTGSHTYAHEGNQTVHVALADAGGASANPSAPASVNDAPLSAIANSVSATATVPFSGTVAHFTDADPSGAPGDFTATIDWGDGNTSPGTVTAHSGGGFDVTGGHTYAHQGNPFLHVTIADTGGASANPNGSATVSEAPVSADGGNGGQTPGSGGTPNGPAAGGNTPSGGGGGVTCVVPKLKGKKIAAARRALAAAHCVLGKVTKKKAKHKPAGRVMRQSPAPGTQLPGGSTVAVTVSKH